MISENLKQFAGRPVKDFDPAQGISDPQGTAYRLRMDWEQHDSGVKFTDRFGGFLACAGAEQLEALVIGDWGGTGEGNDVSVVKDMLVASSAKLSNLSALFIGDMTSEEAEISWITQADISQLWPAFPQLEELGIRGGEGLQLGTLELPNLRKLVIESGGLPPIVVKEVAAASLPNLEHLELWLGTPAYGGDTTVEDVQPILAGDRLPKLRYLGLRDSEIVDQIAQQLQQASILDRIETLDLSLGTLTDAGAAALASNEKLKGLTRLDIHHHFVSEEGVLRLRELGVPIDASERQEADEDDGEIYRYVAVSE